NGVIPPGRVATSFANAQVIVNALQKVNGDATQKQQLLDAINSTDLITAKGPIKLDKYHDIVQNMYVYQITKDGAQYAQKLLATYPEIDQFWGRTPEQSMKFPYGKLKDKWVGMTKADLAKLYS